MMTVREYLKAIRTRWPGFVKSLTSAQREKLDKLLARAEKQEWTIDQLFRAVRRTAYFQAWKAGGAGGGEEPDEEEMDDQTDPTIPPIDEELGDIRAALLQFLVDNELPTSLMSFIEQAIADKKPFSQIVLELRETPEYRVAYPENFMRRELGYSWLPEAVIRQLRDQFRSMTQGILGITLSNEQIARLIASDKSPAEWERRLLTWKQFERYGPVARRVFEEILGMNISDQRLFEFLSSDIPTPELDRAYELALMRAQPASIGLGVRPMEEAELLRSWGLTPEQVFNRYQTAAAELPRFERLAAIEAAVNRKAGQLPPVADLLREATIGQLVRGVVFQDPEALTQLSQMMSREVARFQPGGSPVRRGTASIGLLSPEERG